MVNIFKKGEFNHMCLLERHWDDSTKEKKKRYKQRISEGLYNSDFFLVLKSGMLVDESYLCTTFFEMRSFTFDFLII